VPWRARTVPPTALRRRTGRPQLKRDPLGTYGHTMRNTTRGSVLPALACAVSLLASRAAPAQTAANATVSKTDLEHVLTAIKDEIYALGSYPQYLDLANGMQNIPLYVEPHREHGYIWMIYKLMPCGEVQRAGSCSPVTQRVASSIRLTRRHSSRCISMIVTSSGRRPPGRRCHSPFICGRPLRSYAGQTSVRHNATSFRDVAQLTRLLSRRERGA